MAIPRPSRGRVLRAAVLVWLPSAPLLDAAPGAVPECRAEPVRVEQGARREAFLAWLKSHPKQAGFQEDDGLLQDSRIGQLELRVADVDNDGDEDYVVTTSEGSLHALSLWVFEAARDAWTPLALPFEPPSLWGYSGPRKSESQLLVRFCGRTYISFAGGRGGADYFPMSYLWQGQEARPACDTAWLRHQRREFQSLFDDARYDDAHGLLDGVQAACAQDADRLTWLWMQSDAAFAAYKMRAFEDCLSHVRSARESAAFASADPGVAKALDANAALCESARAGAAGAAPAYDFSWLRELEKKPDVQIVLDPRFDGLLSAVVPEFHFEDGQSLRDAIRLSVWLPEPIEFTGGRYVLITGCQPHDCGNKGLIWIDLVSRQGIVYNGGYVASRTTPPAAYPAEFWKQAPAQSGEYVYAIAPDGRKSQIQAP